MFSTSQNRFLIIHLNVFNVNIWAAIKNADKCATFPTVCHNIYFLQSILGIQPHMSTFRGCFGLSVSGMVSILKAEKEGARVCTVIVRVGRVWNTLWYLCLRCLYIRNGGGLDFSGRAFNRPISYIAKVVWTCLPSALPFTIDQILSTQSGKRNWVEALGQSSSKSPQELSGHRKVYTGGAQRVEIWGVLASFMST